MTIFEQLEAEVLPTMTGYQADLTEHDRREIEENDIGTPFIHIARDMSTHMFMKPDTEWLTENVEQPYLFGRSTPQDIVRGDLGLITDYFKDEKDIWHYYDGDTLQTIDQAKAAEVYGEWQS